MIISLLSDLKKSIQEFCQEEFILQKYVNFKKIWFIVQYLWQKSVIIGNSSKDLIFCLPTKVIPNRSENNVKMMTLKY